MWYPVVYHKEETTKPGYENTYFAIRNVFSERETETKNSDKGLLSLASYFLNPRCDSKLHLVLLWRGWSGSFLDAKPLRPPRPYPMQLLLWLFASLKWPAVHWRLKLYAYIIFSTVLNTSDLFPLLPYLHRCIDLRILSNWPVSRRSICNIPI